MPGRILILDSVAINRVVLRVKLAAACYETFQAETLAEALRVAKAARPDILLFSAAAPGVDPARLVSRFKTLMPGHIIAIMMIEAGSAPASPEAALAWDRRGAATDLRRRLSHRTPEGCVPRARGAARIAGARGRNAASRFRRSRCRRAGTATRGACWQSRDGRAGPVVGRDLGTG